MGEEQPQGRSRETLVREAALRVAEAVAGTATLGEFFERIHGLVAGLMEARNFYVALADPEKRELSFPYFVDETGPAPDPIPYGRTLTDRVLRTGEPLLATPEIFRELVEAGEVVLVGSDGIDWLGVPLLAAGRAIGVLAVQSYSGEVRYTGSDREILQFVGMQAGLAIERRRAEEFLRQTATRMGAILDALPDLLFVFGPDGSYTEIHAPRPDLLVAPSPKLLTARIPDVLPPAESALFMDAIARVLADAGPQSFEYTLDVPAGRRVFEARVVPHGPEAALAIVRDVTKERRAVEDLRRSRTDLQRLADHMVDAVSETDLAGTFLWVSPSTRSVAGISPEELVGHSAFARVHPDDVERVKEELSRPSKRGERGRSEYRYLNADGRWRWVESVGNLLRDAQGEPQRIVLATRDVDARRKAESTLELLREVDRKILQQEPFASILHFLCEEICSRFDYPLVWIARREADGRASVWASAGRAAPYLDEISVRWDETPEGQGLVGEAVRTGAPAKALAGPEDPRQGPWSEALRKWGLASAAGCPLTSGGVARGVLVAWSAHPADFDEATVGLLARFADQVALSIQSAEHMARIELQTAALASTANAVVITGPDGAVEWVNPAFTTLTGWTSEEVIGRILDDPDDGLQPSTFHDQRARTVREGRVWRGERFNRRKDGAVYVEEETVTPVLDDAGRVAHVIAVKQDVTARRRSEERIRHLALHDPLTDLPNRRALEESLGRVVDRAPRGTRSTLVLLDLDNFKIVNDSLGHPAGDRVLVDLARLLVATVRPGDLVYRLGGDEFVVLLEGVPLADGRETAERVRRAVDTHRFLVEGRTFDLGVSLGVVPVDGKLDAPAVLALADSALYAAKEKGKNRVVVFDSGALRLSSLSAASEWASRIKDALRLNRFALYYQPIFRVGHDRPSHWEALLRLVEESGLVIPPSRFLPAAERFGLMPAVDGWVVDNVIGILKSRPGLEIFVNLSGTSLGNEELLGRIEERTREADLGPGRLSFEITETTAVGDVLVAQEWMRRLRELGCRFALDDFGIGFSSFAYLQGLPADYVKIDGSFIRDIDRSDSNRALVRAIDTVAHTLGKQTIAESVESQAALPVLAHLGVDYVQGFALGPPRAEPPTA